MNFESEVDNIGLIKLSHICFVPLNYKTKG